MYAPAGWFLIWFVALGSVVAGIVLMSVTALRCVVGTDLDGSCGHRDHPCVLVGLVVLVAGLIQAFALWIIQRLWQERFSVSPSA